MSRKQYQDAINPLYPEDFNVKFPHLELWIFIAITVVIGAALYFAYDKTDKGKTQNSPRTVPLVHISR